MRVWALLLGLAAAAKAECGCTSGESCCADTSGYSCCIDQESFCVSPGESSSKKFPARCCPQWTVGCDTGSVGCCDPARPWQRDLDAPTTAATPRAEAAAAAAPVLPPLLTANVTVVALFSSPRAANLNCAAVDARTGTVLRLLPVVGPAAAYFSALYGAETRVYPYRPARNSFVFADIAQSGASASSPITLYRIDATTCASAAQVVTGAAGFVVAFAYHPESDTLVLATGAKDANEFDFYAVNLDTGAAAPLATAVPRGASETSSPAFYAPYLSALDLNGTSALRLGYQAVAAGTGPGLGVTPLATGAAATWEHVPTVPHQEALFYSLTRPYGGDAFVSLSPSAAANHTLSVVAWARGGNNSNPAAPRVLLDLPNAHPPGGTAIGTLGYVADVATLDLYAALVVAKGPGSTGAHDAWALAAVHLADGSASCVRLSAGNTHFDPLGAETVSVSGIGILAAT